MLWIYHFFYENMEVTFLNFDFLFFIYIYIYIFFFFSSICVFFLLFFLLHTRTPTPISIFTSSSFFFLFFQFLISRTYLQFSLFLFLSHTHKFLSLYLTQTNSLSHIHIDHRQRTKIRESWPFKSVFMHATWFAPSPLVLLLTSKNMQLNHHIGQIGVLHVFFFGSGLISFILYERLYFLFVLIVSPS